MCYLPRFNYRRSSWIDVQFMKQAAEQVRHNGSFYQILVYNMSIAMAGHRLQKSAEIHIRVGLLPHRQFPREAAVWGFATISNSNCVNSTYSHWYRLPVAPPGDAGEEHREVTRVHGEECRSSGPHARGQPDPYHWEVHDLTPSFHVRENSFNT